MKKQDEMDKTLKELKKAKQSENFELAKSTHAVSFSVNCKVVTGVITAPFVV